MTCRRHLQLKQDIVIISQDFLSLVPYRTYIYLSGRINEVIYRLEFHSVAVGRIKGVFLEENVWAFRRDRIKWP